MKTERFEMRATAELMARIDEWRRLQPDLPNRSEAIRRLIEGGLSAPAKSGGSSDEGSGGKSKTSAPSPALARATAKSEPRSAASTEPLTKEAQLRALRESRA
jgi:hypothetical protein